MIKEKWLSINLFPGVYNITVLFEDDDNYVKSLNTNDSCFYPDIHKICR